MRNCRRSNLSLVGLLLAVLVAAGGCADPSAPGEEPEVELHPYPIEVSVSAEREYQDPDVQLRIGVFATNVADSTFTWSTNGHCIVGFVIQDSNGEWVGGGWDCQTVPMSWPFQPGETRETHGSWDGRAPSGRYYVIGGLIESGGLAYPDTLILDW